MARPRGLGDVGRHLEPPGGLDPGQDLLGPRLVERHPPGVDGGDDLGVDVAAERPQSGVGKGESERQADPAHAHDGDVEIHGGKAR